MKIGILGGGQLAKMLVEGGELLIKEGHDFTLSAFCQSPLEPVCSVLKNRTTIGEISKTDQKLADFLNSQDVILFESEFIKTEVLKEIPTKAHFFPKLEAMKFFRSKWEQKKIFKKLEIPSSEAALLKEKMSEEEFSQVLLKVLSKESMVLKWAEYGYDGKGTFFLNQNEKEKLGTAYAFYQEGAKKGAATYYEEKVNFQKELAMIYVASQKKISAHFPLVWTIQKNGICHKVLGPVENFGISKTLEKEALTIGGKLASDGLIEGVFAIEFFLTENGKLYVNEVAPRVHNSGHYTQDGSTHSQFQAHILSALQKPINTKSKAKIFAMLNFIGNQDFPSPKAPEFFQTPKAHQNFHWYEKKENKKGRKMAHINFSWNEAVSLEKIMEEMDSVEKLWENWQLSANNEK